MKAIILAAGIGDRIKSLNKNKPKCLIKIGDQSLLEIQLDVLYEAGVKEYVIVRGYEGNKITIPGIKYIDNTNYETTNILYSLMCAKEELEGDVLVLYSDILYYKELIEKVIHSKHEITLGTMLNWKTIVEQRLPSSLEDLELVIYNSNNTVVKIGKGMSEESVDKGLFTGIMKLSGKGCEQLKRHYGLQKILSDNSISRRIHKIDQYYLTDLIDDMVHYDVPIHCVMFNTGWLEINTPQDYELACSDVGFLSKLVRTSTDWAVRAQKYDNLDWVNRDKLLSKIVKLVGDLGTSKILDLGTGTGKVLRALVETSKEIDGYGLDISPEMLSKIPKSYDFNLIEGSAEDLSIFDNETFDLITARMVFHHLSNPSKAMAEIWRVLKPGGQVLICEGNPPSKETLDFYVSMFRFKEIRNTFLESDLTNIVLNGNFIDVTTSIVVLKGMSMMNWLNNSGLPKRNIDIIIKMHYECSPIIKNAYNMKLMEIDILMDWKFSIITGIKA